MTPRKLWAILFLACVGSRLLTTIYYVEDPDSLRFALSMIDYDVSKLQPHFPAYPVFCILAKAIYYVIDRYALTFSLVGGLATFFISYFTLAIARVEIQSSFGIISALLLFFNPLLWLMGNRYMPDITGVAIALAAFYLVTRRDYNVVLLGFFIGGLSLGVRLSYAPLLFAPFLAKLARKGPRLWFILATVIGIAVWLLPLFALEGLNNLITAAHIQGKGHFTDFGGTISTEPHIAERVIRIFENLWADGFGFYWSGRNILTAISALALAILLVAQRTTFKPHLNRATLFSLPVISCLLYLSWIFFFQNVVHKSRHVLPLIPFLALIPGFVITQAFESGSRILRSITVLFMCSYVYVTSHLVTQHMNPSAIAQVFDHLKSRNDVLHVVSVPLVKYYLSSRDLEAIYSPVKTEAGLRSVSSYDSRTLIAVGSPLPDRLVKAKKTFFHNLYVNRMWPQISVYEY